MLRNIWTPLADGQPVQHKEPGQLIYLQDTRAECFYYIVSGTVKCYISSPEGEERILTLPHAGELIGEAAFFDRQPRVSSAVAVTPCQLVEVDRQRLTEVFARHPDLAISMLENLARRVRLLSEHVDGGISPGGQAHCPAPSLPPRRRPGRAPLHPRGDRLLRGGQPGDGEPGAGGV